MCHKLFLDTAHILKTWLSSCIGNVKEQFNHCTLVFCHSIGSLGTWLTLYVIGISREDPDPNSKCSEALVQMRVDFHRKWGENILLWGFEVLGQRGDKALPKAEQVGRNSKYIQSPYILRKSKYIQSPYLVVLFVLLWVRLKASFPPFSFVSASSAKAPRWAVVTSGDSAGGTDDWRAAYQYCRTADGSNTPRVHPRMDLIAGWHVLSRWSKSMGEMNLSLKQLWTGPWQWHVYATLRLVTQVGAGGCSHHPASWHAMQLAPVPSSLGTVCRIGRCRDKGCRSLGGSWLACRHQHIPDRKQSESAAAHSTLQLPVPACLHPSSGSISLRYSPAACLFSSQQH